MRKNDVITLRAEDCTAEGSAVCKHEGLVVFVPGGLKGELLSVKILKVKRNCAYGKIEQILEGSPNRITPACPVALKCGGCIFGHLDYSAELAQKRQIVSDAFAHIAKLPVPVNEILSGKESHYRNKAQYPVDINGNVGFFARHSHRIVPCDDCHLQPDIFKSALHIIKQWMQQNGILGYDEATNTGTVRHIYLRYAESTGQLMVTMVINAKTLPASEALICALKAALPNNFYTLVININQRNTNVILSDKCKTLYGSGYITDIICGIKIRISPLSFYQVNRDMAQRLYEKAYELAEPKGKILLDLYCGAGAIGLSMAKDAKEVIGVEIIPQAVLDAEFNASQNGIENARFICADAADAAKQLHNEGIKPDVVILDPPRKGCSQEVINTVAHGFAPERVVYISCDPATLARDCARFAALGYKTLSATPADLFPRTAHVETVALLQRGN